MGLCLTLVALGKHNEAVKHGLELEGTLDNTVHSIPLCRNSFNYLAHFETLPLAEVTSQALEGLLVSAAFTNFDELNQNIVRNK